MAPVSRAVDCTRVGGEGFLVEPKCPFVICSFSSGYKGTAWSVVLYSLTASAACREQHWREASQAFYRVSMVYSSMQDTTCAGTTPTATQAYHMRCQFGILCCLFLPFKRTFSPE